MLLINNRKLLNTSKVFLLSVMYIFIQMMITDPEKKILLSESNFKQRTSDITTKPKLKMMAL